VTKVKGCTGTYLWGPDELEKMRTVGNLGANEIYGAEKVHPDASKEQKQRYVLEKYDKRSFANKAAPAPAKPAETAGRIEQIQSSIPALRVERVGHAAMAATVQSSQQDVHMGAGVPPAARRADIPDSLFDELFNEAEDSYFGNSLTALKPSSMDIVRANPTPCVHVDSCLDDFLNSTLHVQGQSAPMAASKYPVSLNPFLSTQKTAVTDPFSDWPAF
jgi:hypothetical protein